MATAWKEMLWRVPLTILACMAGSLAAVWVASLAMGFTMDPALVVVLSAVLSAAAISLEIRGLRRA